ncbi:Beta-secretase 2 [Kappamyces sp. JEL0829]|nr:Beta-secretase 2 [Kappamyces sp. JEL0829]
MLYLCFGTVSAAVNQLFLPSFPSESQPLQIHETTLDSHPTGAMARQKVAITGGHDTCFLTTLLVANTSFLVRIDTGSTDTALPGSSLNNYSGPNLTYAAAATTFSESYGDSSWWQGYQINVPVGLANSALSSVAPIGLMTKQSLQPVFVDGVKAQGLLGVAYAPLSRMTYTVMDSWVRSSGIPNQLAFHGCPYLLEEQSWIDFGNEVPYSGCWNQSATVMMPIKSYYTLNINSISVGDTPVALPSTFQQDNAQFYGGIPWSIADSCSSNLVLPASVFAALKDTIKNGTGLDPALRRSQYLDDWLDGKVILKLTEAYFNYSALPSLSFQLVAGGDNGYTTVTLTLGPRQYIQGNMAGWYVFMVTTGADSDLFAILGLPLFSAYHIVIDKDRGSMSFSPGCDCENATDGYPSIVQGNENVTWRTSPTGKTPSASSRPAPSFCALLALVSFVYLVFM